MRYLSFGETIHVVLLGVHRAKMTLSDHVLIWYTETGFRDDRSMSLALFSSDVQSEEEKWLV